jgi:ABC-2 type transport system ATP-binding protein
LVAEGTLDQLRQWIPAKEIVTVQTTQQEEAIARAKQYSFICRRYGRDLAFWLPEELELKAILDCFDGIPLDSIARHSVSLEHIYIEVIRD